MFFFFSIVCLSLSLSTSCSQSNHLYLPDIGLQQTYQMWCVATSLCSLRCCVAPVTTDRELRFEAFKGLHCEAGRARALWVKVQLWWLFLCYFVDVKMFARIIFLYCTNAALLLPQSECHVLMQKCCGVVLHLTGIHCESQQNVRSWSSGSPPTFTCRCKVVLFLTRETQDFCTENVLRM